jgi:hypothetical protein
MFRVYLKKPKKMRTKVYSIKAMLLSTLLTASLCAGWWDGEWVCISYYAFWSTIDEENLNVEGYAPIDTHRKSIGQGAGWGNYDIYIDNAWVAEYEYSDAEDSYPYYQSGSNGWYYLY